MEKIRKEADFSALKISKNKSKIFLKKLFFFIIYNYFKNKYQKKYFKHKWNFKWIIKNYLQN